MKLRKHTIFGVFPGLRATSLLLPEVMQTTWTSSPSRRRNSEAGLLGNCCQGIHSACQWQRAAGSGQRQLQTFSLPQPLTTSKPTSFWLAIPTHKGFCFCEVPVASLLRMEEQIGICCRDGRLCRHSGMASTSDPSFTFLPPLLKVEVALRRSRAYGTIVDELGHLVDHLRSHVLCFYHLWSEYFRTTGLLIGLYRHA
jgi:hypothetical protein